VIAAALGADEFGFGTAALLAIGCVMARQCHLNTCPVGIATQDETLRARFTGKPEMVMTYFRGLAQAVRELLASIGATSLAEITGDVNRLQTRHQVGDRCLGDLLLPVAYQNNFEPRAARVPLPIQERLSGSIDNKRTHRVVRKFKVCNADRSLGANLSGNILRRRHTRGIQQSSANFEFNGQAGQSFGAFLVSGLVFRLHGEANDYVGKGLSGGTIAIDAGQKASKRRDILAGNTLLYGATAGELYVAGRAGERFAVRNSGALAVIEGVGDHLCEYMTGGVVVNLGTAGINVGAGMTGGLAYMSRDFLAGAILNTEFVGVESCSSDEQCFLRRALTRHYELTGSPHAARMLSSDSLPLLRVQPLSLPCSVQQTWEPLLKNLPELELEIPSAASATIVESTFS
jgi:glutamate synthase domain-containing protein 3